MHCWIFLLLFVANATSFIRHEPHQGVSWLETLYSDKLRNRVDEDSQSRSANMASLAYSPLNYQEVNYTLGELYRGQQATESEEEKESIGDVVFNVHHFTQLLYNGDQVYIYSPKKNEENVHEPRKWAFFYVPVLQTIKASSDSQWVWIHKNEVRVRLALGTPEVEKAARKAIANQYDNETVEQYSHLWVVAPLMLNSLSAYVVTVSSSLVEGVAPFHIDNPTSNEITFRFACTTYEAAQNISQNLLEGDYDIEISLYFAGMHKAKTNMVTITATQLQAIQSKTIADGGGTNATYIHRDQASSFVATYVANVKKMIYIEDQNANISLLTNGLEEQFKALFQEGIENAKENIINADAFGQVWHSTDLNPDRITSEMNKIFTYNQSETERHRDNKNYYNVNQRKGSSLSVSAALDVRVKTFFTKVDVSAKVDYNKQENEEYEQTSHSAVSETDIQKAAAQSSIEGAWEGEKFVPKSFKVFKLNDVVNRLQVAIISKQLTAEKTNGAFIRRVSALSTSVGSMSLLTGEIKLYAGTSPPSYPWLLCDGSIVSRSKYPRLFSVIGTQYGEGNDSMTFKLPDLRGRVPIGVDDQQLRMDNAHQLGATGGNSNHTLTVEQLPTHAHDQGTLVNSADGVHTHGVHDPGHNHGGQTGQFAVPSTSTSNYGSYEYHTAGYREWQTLSISTSSTHISLYSNGNHTHRLTGDTGVIGHNQSFSILPPFQTFQYIIYAGD